MPDFGDYIKENYETDENEIRESAFTTILYRKPEADINTQK